MISKYYEKPFRHWEVEELFDTSMVYNALMNFPERDWSGWVRYSNELEKNKRTARIQNFSNDHFPVINLLRQLTLPPFVSKVSKLTEVKLHNDPEMWGGGIHIVDPGGWLNCHLDYAKHPKLNLERRINLVAFLNPEWNEEWGGALELWNEAARQYEKRIYPKFNTGVIWEAGDLAYHATQKVEEWAAPRITAACYYLADPRPGCVRQRALFVPNRGG